MYLHILPFQLSFDDGLTIISGVVIVSSDGITISFTLSDLIDGVVIRGDLLIFDSFIGTSYASEIYVDIEGLGEAQISVSISDSIFGTTISLQVDANFGPEDLIEWIGIDPADSDIRARLLQYLPMLRIIWLYGLNTVIVAEADDEGDEDLEGADIFDGFEMDPFDTEDVPEEDPPGPSVNFDGVSIVIIPPDFDPEDLPLNTFGLGEPYSGGRSSWLDSLDLNGPLGEPGIFGDDVRQITALVHIPGYGHSGRVEVIAPRGYLHIDQIVAEYAPPRAAQL